MQDPLVVGSSSLQDSNPGLLHWEHGDLATISLGKSHSWHLNWKFTRILGGFVNIWHTESDTTERIHFHFSLSCIGEGNGSPLQCSCLENPRDGEAWWAAVYGVAQSQTRLKWLSSSINTLFLFIFIWSHFDLFLRCYQFLDIKLANRPLAQVKHFEKN